MKDIILFLIVSLTTIVNIDAIIPSSPGRASLAFIVGKSQLSVKLRDISLSRSLLIRGGDEESDDDDEDSDDDELSETEEEEEDDDDEQNGGEVEEEDDEEEENEEVSVSSLPVKITLKTALSNNILIDQSVEITASPTRTVESLKQSVSRQFKSRPPMDAVTLRLDGRVLFDDELVRDLVDHDEDEEDEEDDEEDEGEDGLAKLTIIVDMVPPVDPKFGTEMKGRMNDMTNEELLDAYVANLAAMHHNSVDLMREDEIKETNDGDVEEEEEKDEEEEEEEIDSTLQAVANKNLAMQRYAHMLKEQIIDSLSEDEKELLQKTDTPSSPQADDLDNYEGDLLLKESIKRRKRKGGATMNVKRALQKNLNINWPDTIRNFLLFLFFGYFGGRTVMSRTIMLLGAPACFIIQARPVKVAIKQLFYTIGEPPGILLSLLPAPQQAIMSCHYDDALKMVYGEGIGACNELENGDIDEDYDDDGELDEASEESDFDGDDDEEKYDEYDEDY